MQTNRDAGLSLAAIAGKLNEQGHTLRGLNNCGQCAGGSAVAR
jgi:hypothetical protein